MRRGIVRFDLSFVVNLDDDAIALAMAEHADAEGDPTHACVIAAREEVHHALTSLTTWDVDEVNVREAEVGVMCDACGASGGDDYETGAGVHLCAGCTNRVLALRVVREVLDNIGAYDDVLGRAVVAIDNDDAAMRASSMPYVDSTSSGWDMMRGENVEGVRAYLDDLMRVVVNATREPGTVIDQ